MAAHVLGPVTLTRTAGVDRYLLRSITGSVLEDRPATPEESLVLTCVENSDDLRAKGLAYLALPAPTQAQTTKAVRALVMLTLAKVDDTGGT